ncbi:RNA 2',3'-cyclic phosphodiesterase [Frondihabitans sp. 762G35]|uniref:2'-5' RNA ligase family protein n=1 Tax=Frondihabitans sp. 762G35 TaxID=1446794 RepID=UPI000D22A560|nr:2'-5' RNA ligase family protein [Frondihabitans sp. 762G35]ARC57584.1 RNA 2',3'-cyclic phosphodiesterase [Frondihabitans sp. 762G35]
MHSLELLLDDATDAHVRTQWSALLEADLPSQARHAGASNAPHVTLLARGSLDASHDDELRAAFGALPVPVELGGLVVFGTAARGLVLARLAVAGTRILRLHETVHGIVGAPDGAEGGAQDAPHTLPGRWTPHVTLASRLTAEQVGRALVALAGTPDAEGPAHFAAARRWDSTLREVTPL